MMIVPVNAGPLGSEKAVGGSSRCWSNVPCRLRARKAATSKLSSTASFFGRGPKKVACVVAALILTTVYHMLKNGTQFEDLGADHFDRRSKDVRAKRLVTQLAKLGFYATPLVQAA